MKIYGRVEMSGKPEVAGEGNRSIVESAKLWERMGAAGLYVDCLYSCINGSVQCDNDLDKLIGNVKIPVTVIVNGRNACDVERILSLGAERVVIGEAAMENETFLEGILRDRNDKVAVLLESNNGMISPKNWVNMSGFSIYNFAGKLAEKGCRNIVYSDLNKTAADEVKYDGIERLCSIGRLKVTLAGWRNSAEELWKLRNIGIDGFILSSPDILKSYNY